MKNVKGIWLPDHEEHLLVFASNEGWTYQKHKLDAAMGFVPYSRRHLAVDIGGHCGLWSRHLTLLFDRVEAFEPVQEHRECFEKNVISKNYTLHPFGLGNEERTARIHTTKGSSGDSHVVDGDEVEIKTLDSFDLAPDFIKIDTEGFEYYICQGGEKTIKAHKPIMVVEQKPNHASTYFGLKDTKAVDLLLSWGYEVRKVISGDYILTCKQS